MYEASEDIFFCAYSYLFDQFDFICLENPRDGGAWWAAIYGVAQSQTRLKRLRSSSSLTKKVYEFGKVRSLELILQLLKTH